MRTNISAALLAFLLAAHAQAQCGFSMGPATTILPSIPSPRAVVIADINNDGRPDVVTASVSTNQVRAVLGNGDGTFGSALISAVGANGPQAMVAGDFNSDGNIDLAVACSGSGFVVILVGDGTGMFSLFMTLTPGAGPAAIATADINHDGILDLVSANTAATGIYVYRGLGNGSFTPATGFTSGSLPSGVVIADFNNDTHPDIAVCSQGTNSVSVLAGNGAGSFATYISIPSAGSGPAAIATGDFNLDGRPDLVVANMGSGTLATAHSAGASFTGFVPLTPLVAFRNVCVTDLNSDGRADLIGVSASPSILYVYAGVGAGSFGPPTSLTPSPGPWGVAAGDLNGDGRMDLVVANNSAANTQEFLNASTTAPAITAQPATTAVLAGQSASFTVAATGGSLTYQWRRNFINLSNGGVFSGVTTPTLTINPAVIADNLGQYDVVITNTCNTVTSRPGVLGVTNCPGDFNGDGAVDFFDYLDFVDAYSIGC